MVPVQVIKLAEDGISVELLIASPIDSFAPVVETTGVDDVMETELVVCFLKAIKVNHV